MFFLYKHTIWKKDKFNPILKELNLALKNNEWVVTSFVVYSLYTTGKLLCSGVETYQFLADLGILLDHVT